MKLDSISAPDSFEDAVLSRSLVTGLPSAVAPSSFEESVLQAAKAPVVQPSINHTTRRPFWQIAAYTTAAVGTIIGTLALWSTSNPSSTTKEVSAAQPIPQIVRAAQVQPVTPPVAPVKNKNKARKGVKQDKQLPVPQAVTGR